MWSRDARQREPALSSQNIGYVIPVPIIEHFLEDTDPQERHHGYPKGWKWDEDGMSLQLLLKIHLLQNKELPVFHRFSIYSFLPSLRVLCEIVQWQKWDHPRRCEPGISLPGCLIRVVFWSAMITFFWGKHGISQSTLILNQPG